MIAALYSYFIMYLLYGALMRTVVEYTSFRPLKKNLIAIFWPVVVLLLIVTWIKENL